MTWSKWYDFTSVEVSNQVPTTCGVFCLARVRDPYEYPQSTSLTIFLGVAASRQQGLRAVLSPLAAGKNALLQREREAHGGLRFCFQANLDTNAPKIFEGVLDLFEKKYGSAPVCNPSAHR